MFDEVALHDRALDEALEGLLKAPWRPIPPDEIEKACDWLSRLKDSEVSLWARNRPVAQHPMVVRALAQRAYSERLRSPKSSNLLALRAVQVTETLNYPEPYAAIAADLRAGALGYLANSYRLLEDHRQADATFSEAKEWQEKGTGDLLLAAELARDRAVLRRDQKRYEDAISLHELGAVLFEEVSEYHDAGKIRLAQAITHFDDHDHASALDAAALAGQLIDPRREPEMGFALMHNTLFFLEAYKLPTAALTLFHRLKPMYEDMDSPLVVVRAMGLSGRLFLAGGQYRPAAKYFDAARKAFLDHGLVYDAALAGFDAARAWAHLRQPGRVQVIAEQMFDVFTAKEIPAEAAAAFELFVNAARASQADAAFMTALAERLAKAPRP